MARTNAYVGFSRRGISIGLGLGIKKTRVPGLLVSENHMILGSLVLMHYQRVTDRHTAYS